MSRINRCNIHTENMQKYICLHEECKNTELICKECVFTKHINHKIFDSKIFFTKSKKTLEKKFKENSIQNEKSQIYLDCFEQLKVILTEFYNETINSFNEIFNKIESSKKLIEHDLRSSKLNLEKLKKIMLKNQFIELSNLKDKNILDIKKHFFCSNNKLNISLLKNSLSNIQEIEYFDLSKYESEINDLKYSIKSKLDPDFFFPNTVQKKDNIDLTIRKLKQIDFKKNFAIKGIQSLNDKLIITGCDNIIRLCDDSCSIWSLEAHQSWIRVSASLNEILATGSDDSTIRIWEMKNKKLEEKNILSLNSKAFNQKSYHFSLIFLPEKTGLLATGKGQNDNYAIKIWNYKENHLKKSLFGHQNIVRKIFIVEKIGIMITLSDEGRLKVWDIDNFNCKKTIYAHLKQVYSMALNEKEMLLVTAGSDDLIKIWNIHPFFNNILSINCTETILSIENIENENLFVCSTTHFLRFYSWENGDLVLSIHTEKSIHSLLYLQEKKTLYSGDTYGKLSVWKLE